MSDRKAKTMDLKGNEYAKVPERLKLFREDCPNGSIETTPLIQPDGQIMFKARILKDKSNPSSGEATGHSLGVNKTNKDFEKLETIAVGRALALLGYLASGEVASFEEMEEFQQHKKDNLATAIAQGIERIEDAQSIEELKEVFVSLGALISEETVVEAKDKRKAELSGKDQPTTQGKTISIPNKVKKDADS